MDRNYDGEFRMCKLISGGLLVSSCIIAGFVEFSVSKFSSIEFVQLLSSKQLETVSIVFGIIGALLVCLSIAIRFAVRRLDPGHPSAILVFWTHQLINSRSGAMAMLIPPVALAETVIVLGAVLFILYGGERMPFYIAVVMALPLFLITYPGENDKEKLSKLDELVRGGTEQV